MSQRGVDEAEDRKPVIPGVHVTLKVKDTDGRSVYHTMRRAEPLQGLIDFYYASVPAVARGTGRFLYEGGRLSGEQTPAQLKMEDGDEVDFFTELMGGGGTSALPKADGARFVTLKVVDQEQRLVRRTIRVTGKLQVVMDAYYDEATDVAYGTGSFWFENVRLRGERTPEYFKLEDGDAIDFFGPQLGGGLLAYAP